ncbi:AmpD protein [Paraburkholderia sp. MM5496-R1]
MSGAYTVDADGWVPAARKLASPNFEARPQGALPTLIVVHNISLPPNQFGGTAIAELFQNALDCNTHPYYDTHLRGVRVSAHFVIHRDGALEQFVSCNERAWHAGPSNFFGRERCNDFSIGIELEGSDTTAFEAAQYRTLAALVRALKARYPIDALAGHSDIAPRSQDRSRSVFRVAATAARHLARRSVFPLSQVFRNAVTPSHDLA